MSSHDQGRTFSLGLGRHLCLGVAAIGLLSGCNAAPSPSSGWTLLQPETRPSPRHEASLVEHEGDLYLIGGRGERPVDRFDPDTQDWTPLATPELEMHHFQAVSFNGLIYIIGAMTGPWPGETAIDRVVIYDPVANEFRDGPSIPEDRRRGGAGAVAYDGKIYLVGGIIDGHRGGTVPWFDVFDPQTGAWQTLPDAPDPRDHFQAAVLDGRLYAFGGRRSSYGTGEPLELTNEFGNVFDFESGEWLPVTEDLTLPTQRAGTSTASAGGLILIGGGESASQKPAHKEVEAYDPTTRRWVRLPDQVEGRHGAGFAVTDGYLYTAAGANASAGGPEVDTTERLAISEIEFPTKSAEAALKVHKRWHTVTLDLRGPSVSEADATNPFTDYVLETVFERDGETATVRGFFAADGNSADTGATGGDVWRTRFSPSETGRWTYRTELRHAPGLALREDAGEVEAELVASQDGAFIVAETDRIGRDFRARGPITATGGQLRQDGDIWLKGGTNSPENFLGFQGFDGTYRLSDNARDGEATAGTQIHTFSPHLDDWRLGDPLWADGQGKGIVGAANYMADVGLNAAYFLTMNILGDGKDVWPYASPDDVMRFDVSKLAQWERLFAHMQARGILLHVVLQETENELMLDGGDTGPERRLYLQEMVARFGHHNGLVWNLGEENGPVHWRPEGQNTEQRMAMASFIKLRDPYDRPVFLHTHSEAEDKDAILTPLLGFAAIDGLSFQVSKPETVHAETAKWRELSNAAGHPWTITMDEIGPWQVGAAADEDDPDHDRLRRHALWGHLLAGGSGVEWYFGAHQKGNDLTTEDLRSRERLWVQTRMAQSLMEPVVTQGPVKPCTENGALYCGEVPGRVRVTYHVGETPTRGGQFFDAKFGTPVCPTQDNTVCEVRVPGHDVVRIAPLSD